MCNNIESKMKEMLVKATNDKGFSKDEVLVVFQYAEATGKKKRGYAKVLDEHLTTGRSFAEEYLEDLVKMDKWKVAMKYLPHFS